MTSPSPFTQAVRASLLSHKGWILLLGVFLTFAPVMVLSVTVPRGDNPWWLTLAWFAISGSCAVLWSLTGLLSRRLLPLAILVQLAAVACFSGLLDPSLRLARPGLSLAGLGSIAFIALGYVCLVRFIRDQGMRTLRLATEMELAAGIHRHLAPRVALEVGDLSVTGVSAPSGSMGGDLVDAALLPGGVVEAVVVDVSGHGVRAGVVMAMVKAVLHARRRRAEDDGLTGLLADVNRVLLDLTSPADFATMVAVRAAPGGAVEYAISGHPPILHITAAGVRETGGEALPMGVLDEAEPAIGQLSLAPGESLLLYTDGLTEAEIAPGRRLEVEGLAELAGHVCSGAEPDPWVDALLRAVSDRTGGAEAQDDRTVLLLHRAGGNVADHH